MLQNWQTQYDRRKQQQRSQAFFQARQAIEQDGNYCPNINEHGFDAYLMYLRADKKGRIRKNVPHNTVVIAIGPSLLSQSFELEEGILYQIKYIQRPKSSRKAIVNTEISLYVNAQGQFTFFNTSKLRQLATCAKRYNIKSLIVDCSDPYEDMQILGRPSLHTKGSQKPSAKHFNRIK